MTDAQTNMEKKAGTQELVEIVATKIGRMVADSELHLPKNYSAQNALKAAWLQLQKVKTKDGKLALAVCSKASIANALLDMVVQGLNPARQQCYFVAFGKQLVLMRSYFGSVAVLRRAFGPTVQVNAQVVYEGDRFKYGIRDAKMHVDEHDPSLDNVDNEKIIAAYAVISGFEDGRDPHTEIMTMDKIRRAWKQGQTNGDSPAHKGFADEMAKKTVINRACKLLVNSSDDGHLVEAIHRQDVAMADAETEALAETEANRFSLDFGIEDEAEPLELPAANGDNGTEPETAEPAQEEAEEPAQEMTPPERFNQIIGEYQLQPTQARKVAAGMVKLDDPRKMTHDDLRFVADNLEEFLATYHKAHPDEVALPPAQTDLLGD